MATTPTSTVRRIITSALGRLSGRGANELSNPESTGNKWVDAFFGMIGGNYASYDTKGPTYVAEGFQKNSAVYSVIRQRYEKVRSIPYFIRKIDDEQAAKQLKGLIQSTHYDFAPHQKVAFNRLRVKAYRRETMPLPLERPNPLQTWSELFALYELFMCVDGNAYFYMLRTGLETLGNEPFAVYILPSHLMTIVVKDKAAAHGADSPIDHYMLTDGPRFIKFYPEEIIHIKSPNPDFGQDGAHLYGQSPLRAVLRSVQSFNEAVDNNGKTMRNSGAYGLIHGKGHRSMTKTQADQIKERLEEMDNSTGRLGQITGVSAEIGFTRIAMTTEELKPFEFLNFDEKQIANALGWDTRLLNQDAGATFDNLKVAEKRVLVATTKPSLDMLTEAFNREFLPRFKKYAGHELIFDFSELPEMQVDMKSLVDWLSVALDRGVINRDEFREAIGYDAIKSENMEKFTVSQFLEPLDEAIENAMSLANQPPIRNPEIPHT